MKKKTSKKDEGLNGSGEALVNTNSAEFKELQNQIHSKSKKQSKKKIIENKLLGLRFKMESYLQAKDDAHV